MHPLKNEFTVTLWSKVQMGRESWHLKPVSKAVTCATCTSALHQCALLSLHVMWAICWPRHRGCVGDTEGGQAEILFLSVGSTEGTFLSIGLPLAKELTSTQHCTGENGNVIWLNFLEDSQCKLEVWAGCLGNRLDIIRQQRGPGLCTAAFVAAS